MRFPVLLLLVVLTHFGYLASAQAPTSARIYIDKGNTFTNSYLTTIQAECAEAQMMMVSNFENFTGATWAPYRPLFQWELQRVDGEQMVYAKFKDKNGNEIGSAKDKILVDATPPQNCAVRISLASKHLNKRNVPVDLVLAGGDAKFMMLSNTSSFYNQKWRAYTETLKAWDLESNDDGEYKVYAKFRDAAGNISETVFDFVVVDTQAPTGAMVLLDKNNKYTIRQDRKVEVELTIRDADSMMVSLEQNFAEAKWELFKPFFAFTLPDQDGTYSFFAKFKDKAGNVSEVASDQVISDITPPKECAILINGGAASTNDINKEVQISLQTEPGVEQMLISNFPSFKGARWQKYEKTIVGWRLDGETDGPKSVYVKLKDEAGNISGVFQATIQLQRGF